MKSIIITRDQWKILKQKFNEDYPPSVSLVREKMKRVIGCTPRFHELWDAKIGFSVEVHLDFFDEQKKTFFLLKYSNYVESRIEDRIT